MMTEEQKQQIIDSGKNYFRKIIIPGHLKNLQALKLKDFKINPFLVNYLAAFLCGNTDPESLAKALLYPRILGTSISTSFGQNIQVFISSLAQVAGGASGIDGIDIEFEDAIDGRKKYCQCKAGPQELSMDNVATILGRFKHLQKGVSIDQWDMEMDDMIVCVMFGEKHELPDNDKIINSLFPVYCGAEFWEHITGDKQFYHRLAKAFGEVVEEDDTEGKHLVLGIVKNLSDDILEHLRTYAYKPIAA